MVLFARSGLSGFRRSDDNFGENLSGFALQLRVEKGRYEVEFRRPHNLSTKETVQRHCPPGVAPFSDGLTAPPTPVSQRAKLRPLAVAPPALPLWRTSREHSFKAQGTQVTVMERARGTVVRVLGSYNN